MKRFVWDKDIGRNITITDTKTNRVYDKYSWEELEDVLNELSDENEQLRKENQQYKSILQGMGLLLSDDDVISIRKDIAEGILKPLLKENGFDVDIDVSDGFTIIPRGENDELP